MPYTIDKNVPIPEATNKATMSEQAKMMEIGDSIGSLTNKEAKSLGQAIRNLGFQQHTRKEEGGNRVWKKAALTTDK